MKAFKILFLLVVFMCLAAAYYVYYPQYQIDKIKKETIHNNTINTSNQETYLMYLKGLKENQLIHLGLGDSVIRGTGSVENQNYISDFSRSLSNVLGKNVVSDNEGIIGLTSEQLKEMILSGRFDVNIKKANIISINVGGNDILHVVSEGNFYTAINQFDNLKANFKNNIETIINLIKIKNPKAVVLVLELYNPLNPNSGYYSTADKLLPLWNLVLYQTVENQGIIVETDVVLNKDHRNYLSSDGIHPNSIGYENIANQVMNQMKVTTKS